MQKIGLFLGILLTGCIATCQQTGSEAKKTALTFSHDVAPILYEHCVYCHHPGDIAPMSLLTYKEVRPWAAAIRQAVVSRKMPPWLADPAVGHWSNDPRFSEADIRTIRAWVEGPKAGGRSQRHASPAEFSGRLEDRQARCCDLDSGAYLGS